MSKLFLDLAKLKKISSDGKTSVFEHSAGHQVHVNHKSLSPKMKAELEDLLKRKPEASKKQKKPEPQKFAEGTPDGPIEEQQPSIPIDLNATPNLPLSGEMPAMEATPAPGAEPYGTVPANNLLENPLGGLPEQTSPPAPTAPPVPEGMSPTTPSSTPEIPGTQAGPAQMPQPKAPEAQGLSQVTGGLTKGIEEQRQGIEQEAKAKVQLSHDTANALAAGQINKDMADSHYREQLSSLEQERQHLSQDIKDGHIKPDQYISDMTVPGKIMTGIGLILGGIGGGLTHQENPAMKFLDAQIDRNIKAQTAELGKKENLLSANMRQFGNIQQARDFTRVQQNDMVKNMIDQAAAKAGTPMAQAEALKAKGLLDQNSGMLMSKIGAMSTLNSPNAGMGDINAALQSLRLTAPEQAKEIEQRLVPGVGIATVPVPADTRNKILAHKQLDERAKDLLDFASKHTGALDPRIKAQGEQKVLALQSLYREGVLGTVYREGEQPLLDKIVKDPTSFFNKLNNIPKLQELIRSNDARYNVMKQELGLRPLPGMQSQEQGRPQIKTFKKAQ